MLKIIAVLLIGCSGITVFADSGTYSAHLRTLQSSDVAEANRLNDSAMKLYESGKYDDALSLFIEALAIAERSVGTDHPFVAIVLDNLARVNLAKRQFSHVERLLQRSLRIREKAFGEDSLETSQSSFNLGDLYQMTSDFAKASPLYERVLTIRERLLKPGDVNTVVAAFRYSCVLRKTSREKEAERIESRSQLNGDKQFPQQPSGSAASGGGIRTGKVLSSPQPSYPAAANSAHVSGKARVQILIDEKGAVINACAVSGDPVLWQSAEMAAYQARFSPTTLSGIAVRTPGILTYDFRK